MASPALRAVQSRRFINRLLPRYRRYLRL